MISIEAARDGFVILVGGEKVIVHSRRSPCIEIGCAEISIHRVRGSVVARRRRTSWTVLREFSVVTNTPEETVIDFGGQIRMRFSRGNEFLRLSFVTHDPAVNLFRLRIQAHPAEAIYGLGERASRIDLKGRRHRLWVSERGGVFEGDRGYIAAQFGSKAASARGSSFPLSTFVSSRNYWCTMDSSSFAAFDFRRRASTLLESWSVPREVVIGVRKNAIAALADLGAVAGRQPSLPSWSYDGVWLGVEAGQGGVAGMAANVEACLAGGAKVAAVWTDGILDRKHGAQRRRPLWDSAAGRAMVDELGAQAARWRGHGIRYLGWADPCIDPTGPLFKQAEAARYLVRDQEGSPCLVPAGSGGGGLALVDLTNRDARAWLKSLLSGFLVGSGAAGWIADSGGRLPADCQLASGEDPRLLHNRWPLLWAELSAEVLAEAKRQGDSVFLMRSGWLGSGRLLPSAFANGRAPSFSFEDGLPSIVPAALSLGLSGLGAFHSEVGGSQPLSHVPRTAEAMLRWMEMAAFSPLFRTRAMPPVEEKARPHADAAYLSQLARMSDIFAALKSYHLFVAEEYLGKGLPEIRHPYLHYEGCRGLEARENQYLYGPDLLVAPTLCAGKELTELFLPDDEWVHLWSSRCFRGGLVTVETPIGCPAVFYRARSSFAPLFDSIRKTARRI